ncbi:MAG: SRPBCC domain-containing protein [Chloroflexota bacterium]
MININLYTMICKPIEEVFDFVSQPENDIQWQYGTLNSPGFAKGLGKVGALFRSIGHLMGRRNLSAFEVTEYEPNSKFGFKSVSGPLQSYTSYTLESAKGVTKISLSTQANVVNFFQVDESKLEKAMKKQSMENLAILKNLLEAK